MNITRVLSADGRTIKLTWPEIPNATGFQFAVDGRPISHTMDGTRTSARFTLIPDSQPHTYEVRVLAVGDRGSTTYPDVKRRVIGFATGAGPNTPTALTGASLTGYMEKIKQVGGNAVRFDCRGLTTQFDTAVQAALAAGLKVLILFPDDPTLAGPCAAKYVPLGVTDYETGNEPNIRGTSPAQFLARNNAAYQAVKNVSADTKVISAGLAPYGSYTGKGNNPVWYLEQTLALGELLYDQLGWHPYNFGQAWTAAAMLADQPWSAWTQMADTTPSAVSVLAAHGLKQLLAITEFGAPTWTGGVTEQAQADLATAALASLKARPYVGDVYWYSLQDRVDLTGREASFGLYRADWTPKPAAAAFTAAVSL